MTSFPLEENIPLLRISSVRYANNLKSLQTTRGLTIDQAATAMGRSRGGYLKVQRGENRLNTSTITRAAQAFGVLESEILSGPVASEPAYPGETVVAEFVSVVAPDGITMLLSEIREMWGLRAGDRVEFLVDHAWRWRMRPRNASPLDFLKFLPPRPKQSDPVSDAAALAKVMRERNRPSSA